MLAGLSTACLYPQNTEDALRLIATTGVQATEVFLNSDSELAPAYIRELRQIADGSGIRTLSVHPYTSGMEPMLFFSAYTRRFEDGREYYKRYYEAVNLLGGDIVVFHGHFAGMKIEPQDYFHRFAVLLEDARQAGVRLCHENVSRCYGRSPDFFVQMRAALPRAEYVLDVKQAVRSGATALEFVRAMGKNIAHVHISDHDADHDCLPPGKGTFNIGEFLNLLRCNGYDGGVLVELYRENFGDIVELLLGYQQLYQEISTLANYRQSYLQNSTSTDYLSINVDYT